MRRGLLLSLGLLLMPLVGCSERSAAEAPPAPPARAAVAIPAEVVSDWAERQSAAALQASQAWELQQLRAELEDLRGELEVQQQPWLHR